VRISWVHAALAPEGPAAVSGSLGLAWVVAAVSGITLHSSPWEGFLSWCYPPQRFPGLTSPHVHVQPHFTPLCLGQSLPVSSTGGDRGGGERSVRGEEGDARVLLWRWLAQLYFITRKNETTRSSPQFAEAARQGPGGLQPVLGGPRPGPVQHLGPRKRRRAGLGVRK